MKFGGKLITPNAHRCLNECGRNLRRAWSLFVQAVRWQARGF